MTSPDAPAPDAPGPARRSRLNRVRHVELVLAALAFALVVSVVVVHVVDVPHDLYEESLRYQARRRFHPHRHPVKRDVVDLISEVGQVQVMTVIGGVCAAVLARRGAWSRAAAVFAVGYAAAYAVAVGKLLIRHPVADEAFGMPIGTFPSGHTADVTAVLGVVLVVLLPLRRRWVAYLLAASVGLLVAWARQVSGAHTPDDTTASFYLAMALVLFAGWWLARRERALPGDRARA